MKKIIIFLCIMNIFLCTLYIKKTNTIYSVSKTERNNESSINKIDEIHKSKIKIYFPITNYQLLDSKINDIIKYYLNEFNTSISENKFQRDTFYTLYILYDEYNYKQYASYILYIEMFTGGAHPNHFIKTIIYDKNDDRLINIDDLINYNQNILNILSEESRTILKSNPKFTNAYSHDMLYEGTEPTIENFSNFVFTDDGIKIFFDYYQIAPYYYGVTEILIPWDKIYKKN